MYFNLETSSTSLDQPTITIEQVTPQDQVEVLHMVLEFYKSDAVDHPVSSTTLGQTLKDVLDPSNDLIQGFVVKENQEILGFFYLTFFYACEVGGICVMIEEIFIKKEHQGKGLGKSAMHWILSRYPSAKRFRLEVTESNEGAVALYKHLGFDFLEYKQMVLDR